MSMISDKRSRKEKRLEIDIVSRDGSEGDRPKISYTDTFKIIMFGQALAIAEAGTGIASTTYENKCGDISPTAQSFFTYIILSFHMIYLRHHQQQKQTQSKQFIFDDDLRTETYQPLLLSPGQETSSDENSTDKVFLLPFTNIELHCPWYYYFIIAFLDVEANYLTYLSFRYTSLTSITILASLTLPSTMIFSKLILNTQYNLWHIAGVVICLAGLIVNVSYDIENKDENNDDYDEIYSSSADLFSQIYMVATRDSFPHPFLGDFIAMAGAILFGLNDVLCETCVKNFSTVEYLGMLGLFGSMIGLVQILILERDAFSMFSSDSISCSPSTSFWLNASNAFCLCIYYIGAGHFLDQNDAALLEVSLLTDNLYTVIFVIAVQGLVPPIPCFIGMMLVVIGVFVHEGGNSVSSSNEHDDIVLQDSIIDEVGVGIYSELKEK